MPDLITIYTDKNLININKIDNEYIRKLRNNIMHHSILLFGNATSYNEQNNNLNEIEKQLNCFIKILPSEYQDNFIKKICELNSCKNKYLKKFYLESENGTILIKK